MTDAPITHQAKVKLESLIMDGDVRGATNQVLADMRTIERDLNAAKTQLVRIKEIGCDRCLQGYCCADSLNPSAAIRSAKA